MGRAGKVKGEVFGKDKLGMINVSPFQNS